MAPQRDEGWKTEAAPKVGGEAPKGWTGGLPSWRDKGWTGGLLPGWTKVGRRRRLSEGWKGGA